MSHSTGGFDPNLDDDDPQQIPGLDDADPEGNELDVEEGASQLGGDREEQDDTASVATPNPDDEHREPDIYDLDDQDFLDCVTGIVIGGATYSGTQFRARIDARDPAFTPAALNGAVATLNRANGGKKFKLSPTQGWVEEGVVDNLGPGAGAGLTGGFNKPKAKQNPKAKKKLKAVAEEDEKLNCKVPKSTVHQAKTIMGAIFAAMGEWCFYFPRQIVIKAGLIAYNSAKGLGNTVQFTGYKTASVMSSPFNAKFSERMQDNATTAYNRAKQQDGIFLAAGNVAMAVPNKLVNMITTPTFINKYTGGQRGASFGQTIDETGSCLVVSSPVNAVRLVAPRNLVVLGEVLYVRAVTQKGDPRRDDATYKLRQAAQNWRGMLPFTASLAGEAGKDYDEYAKNNAKTDPGAFFHIMRQKELGPSNMPAHEVRITAPTTKLSNATRYLNAATAELNDLIAKEQNTTDPKEKAKLIKQIAKQEKAVDKAIGKMIKRESELETQVNVLAARFQVPPGADIYETLDNLKPHVELNVINAAKKLKQESDAAYNVAHDAKDAIPQAAPELTVPKPRAQSLDNEEVTPTLEAKAKQQRRPERSFDDDPEVPSPPRQASSDEILVTATQAPAPGAALTQTRPAPQRPVVAPSQDEESPDNLHAPQIALNTAPQFTPAAALNIVSRGEQAQNRRTNSSVSLITEDSQVRPTLIEKLKAAFTRLEQMFTGRKELRQRFEKDEQHERLSGRMTTAAQNAANAARKKPTVVNPTDISPDGAPKAPTTSTKGGLSSV